MGFSNPSSLGGFSTYTSPNLITAQDPYQGRNPTDLLQRCKFLLRLTLALYETLNALIDCWPPDQEEWLKTMQGSTLLAVAFQETRSRSH